MPDTPIASHMPFPDDPSVGHRFLRLAGDMRDMQTGLSRVETTLAEIKAMLGATLPHLATRAEVTALRGEVQAGLAEKPGKLYMWGILAVLIAAWAAGLAGFAVLK